MKNNIRANQSNAVITLKSAQVVEGQTDSSTLTAEAVYRYSPDRTTISFSQIDPDENGAPSVQNTLITVMGGEVVTICRTGAVESEMILRVGQTYPCEYVTPMGTLALELYGLTIQPTLSEAGGRLLLQYSINIDGAVASTNTIDLSIMPK